MKEWVGGERVNTLEGLAFEAKKVSRFLQIAKRERFASLSDFSLLDPLLENELSEIAATSICFESLEIEKDESVLAYLVWGEAKKKEVTPYEKDLLSDLIEFALKRLLRERFLIPSTGGSSFRLENIRDHLPRL